MKAAVNAEPAVTDAARAEGLSRDLDLELFTAAAAMPAATSSYAYIHTSTASVSGVLGWKVESVVLRQHTTDGLVCFGLYQP